MNTNEETQVMPPVAHPLWIEDPNKETQVMPKPKALVKYVTLRPEYIRDKKENEFLLSINPRHSKMKNEIKQLCVGEALFVQDTNIPLDTLRTMVYQLNASANGSGQHYFVIPSFKSGSTYHAIGRSA